MRVGEGDGRTQGQVGGALAGGQVEDTGLEAGEALGLEAVAGVGGVPGLGVRVLVGAEQVGRGDEAERGQALVAHLLLEVEVNLVRGASVQRQLQGQMQ